jgi:hypothetical protein
MPNICLNELTVTGNKEELDRFLEAARGRDEEAKPFSLQSLFPLPAELDTDDPVSSSDETETWYSWCVRNWGTKWDVIDYCKCKRESEEKAVLYFGTANSPCDEAFTRKIAPEFPALTFTLQYEEPNCQLEGEYGWSGGKPLAVGAS